MYLLSFILIRVIMAVYVPEVVYRSPVFYIALVLLIAGSMLYHRHNRKAITIRPAERPSKNPPENNSQVHPGIYYTSNGRSGNLQYRSVETIFSLYYEFSEGPCIASISIPSPDDWERITALPLSRRDEILEFIGQQVIRDQVGSGDGHFKIEGDWLNLYA